MNPDVNFYRTHHFNKIVYCEIFHYKYKIISDILDFYLFILKFITKDGLLPVLII